MKKLLVILLVLGLAAPAMAGDWYFYGSARTHLGYYMVDQEYTGGPATDGTIRAAGDDDAGTNLNLFGQSRLGAKAVASDNLTGVVEFGLRETGSGGDEETVYLRLIYGTWNFGAGKLTVGKNYTPATFLGYSGMGGDIGDNGDANMLVAGLAYIGRQPQIRLTFGGFDFALIQPNTGASSLGYTDRDFVLPRVEASYVFRTPVFSIRPILGLQTYDVETFGGDSDSILSYTLGLGATVNLGPAYIKATVSYLQNPGNYGQTNLLALDAALVGAFNAGLDSNGDVEDSKLLQGTFVVGANFNKSIGVEFGVGYGNIQNDGTAAGEVEQTGMIYYLQAPITVAKGVTIIPEIGFLDRGDLTVNNVDFDAGTMTYVDVNFRVDF